MSSKDGLHTLLVYFGCYYHQILPVLRSWPASNGLVNRIFYYELHVYTVSSQVAGDRIPRNENSHYLSHQADSDSLVTYYNDECAAVEPPRTKLSIE